MNCGNAKSLFSPYLDGAVTGKQMGELRQHMVECAECAGEYAMLRKTHGSRRFVEAEFGSNENG